MTSSMTTAPPSVIPSECLYPTRTASSSSDMFEVAVYLPVMITVVVLGIVGNSLTIIVLNKEKKSTANFLLKSLAVVDNIYLVTELQYFSFPSLYLYTGVLFGYNIFFNYVKAYLGYVMWVFKYSSNYMVLLMTIERYVAVCYPMSAARWCTMRKIRISAALVLATSVLYNIPKIWYYKVEYRFDSCTNRTLPISTSTDLYSHNKYFREIYVVALYIIFLYAVPLVILVVLNSLLIKSVLTANKRRICLSADVKLSKTSDNVTYKIISVVTTFIVLESPAIFVNVLFLLQDQIKMNEASLKSALIGTYALFAINSFINFFLYCLVGQRFRRNLMRTLRCQDKPKFTCASSIYSQSASVKAMDTAHFTLGTSQI